MTARRRIVALTLLLAGCGSGEAPTVTPPVTLEPSSAPAVPPPSTAGTTIPDDFAISVGGGPVASEMLAPGTVETSMRLEPRPGAVGAFDLVETSQGADPTSATPPSELRRVAVPTERAVALYGLIVANRGVLEQPCIDQRVMDGATRRILVHASGADSTYSCSNATTPEFDAVQTAFESLVSELLPPVPAVTS